MTVFPLPVVRGNLNDGEVLDPLAAMRMLSISDGTARLVHTATMIFVLLLLSFEQAPTNPKINAKHHTPRRMAIAIPRMGSSPRCIPRPNGGLTRWPLRWSRPRPRRPQSRTTMLHRLAGDYSLARVAVGWL